MSELTTLVKVCQVVRLKEDVRMMGIQRLTERLNPNQLHPKGSLGVVLREDGKPSPTHVQVLFLQYFDSLQENIQMMKLAGGLRRVDFGVWIPIDKLEVVRDRDLSDPGAF